MNEDPAKLSLSNFLAGESRDPLQAPPSFTAWMQAGAWAVELYEPELLASADARTNIRYDGKSQSVINLCSYNYLGLANHPDVVAAAHEALNTHGLGACGSPMLSGMTDLHRELESRIAKFLGREDAMLFNSGFGGALGTISGLLRKSDVAVLDNRSHLSLRDGAVLSRCRTEKFENMDAARLSNLEWKTASRSSTAPFPKLSERSADLSPDRKRPCNICDFTRILTFIRARYRRLSSPVSSKGWRSPFAMEPH